MKDRRVDSLLVVDENNVLQGLLNVEMIDRGRNMETSVREVMLYRIDCRSRRYASS